MNPESTPNERLRKLVDILPVTQAEIARALSVDASLVSKWVRGTRRLHANSPYLRLLAATLAAVNMAPTIRRRLAHITDLREGCTLGQSVEDYLGMALRPPFGPPEILEFQESGSGAENG